MKKLIILHSDWSQNISTLEWGNTDEQMLIQMELTQHCRDFVFNNNR